MWFAAGQAGSKPATSSAPEVKTEQPPQSAESKPDLVGTVVKQDSTAAAADEPAKSAEEAPEPAGKDESEDKAVKVEDSSSEEKMDTDASEQTKIEEVEEEVSLWTILRGHLNIVKEFARLL